MRLVVDGDNPRFRRCRDCGIVQKAEFVDRYKGMGFDQFPEHTDIACLERRLSKLEDPTP